MSDRDKLRRQRHTLDSRKKPCNHHSKKQKQKAFQIKAFELFLSKQMILTFLNRPKLTLFPFFHVHGSKLLNK